MDTANSIGLKVENIGRRLVVHIINSTPEEGNSPDGKKINIRNNMRDNIRNNVRDNDNIRYNKGAIEIRGRPVTVGRSLKTPTIKDMWPFFRK